MGRNESDWSIFSGWFTGLHPILNPGCEKLPESITESSEFNHLESKLLQLRVSLENLEP